VREVILALDPAKKCGVAIGAPGERPHLSVVNFARELDEPEDIFARSLKWIDRALDGVIGVGNGFVLDKPTLLAIEAPIAPSEKFGFTTFDTTLIALGLSAIFRGSARARGIPIMLAPINSWRKYCLSRGNLKGRDAKAAMIRLCRGLGWGDAIDHNAAEAAGIFLWASGQINPRLATRPEPLFAGAPS
jgi:hypothetical protein